MNPCFVCEQHMLDRRETTLTIFWLLNCSILGRVHFGCPECSIVEVTVRWNQCTVTKEWEYTVNKLQFFLFLRANTAITKRYDLTQNSNHGYCPVCQICMYAWYTGIQTRLPVCRLQNEPELIPFLYIHYNLCYISLFDAIQCPF